MKYSDLIGEWLKSAGYTHCFFVAGGGIMHLLDGFRTRFTCIPVVHEMSAGICAEHFNQCRTANQRAFALVTTGPGLTNIVTAIAGCYVEHRELLVIAGQVKSTDLLTYPERQRGVQEVDGAAICQPIALHSRCLKAPADKASFLSMVHAGMGPHPGPVLIEVCLDVQGAQVDPAVLGHEVAVASQTDATLPIAASDLRHIVEAMGKAKRPLILMGGLMPRSDAWSALPQLESAGIPVATTTSAIDRIPTRSPVFAGRPGTWGGQRAGNLVVAQADVVLVLGAQLDLQQTGFNYQGYAPSARLIHVFPSQTELNRSGPDADRKILASPGPALSALLTQLQWRDTDGWLDYVRTVLQAVPALEPANTSAPDFVNSFAFLGNLSRATRPRDILALCSSGGTFTGSLQNYAIAQEQTATTSAAHASMGYGLATAIGAAFANPGRRVIMTEGEGGFSQNMQELAVIKRHRLPIKIFLLDNAGYASIRATQRKFFKGAYLGCDPETGLDFPDWHKLFDAYDIPCSTLGPEQVDTAILSSLLDAHEGPEAWIVSVDPEQPNWPAVSTILGADGSLSSSPLYDMLPKLDEAVLAKVGQYLPGR